MASKTGRLRSFGGCATCRNRRVKCDEGRPTCLVCRAADLTCGYEKSLFFDAGDGGKSTRSRRTVLTIDERKSMSQLLTSSVPPQLALWTITQIDEHCEAASPSDQLEVTRGPFGAFKVLPTATFPSKPQATAHLGSEDSEFAQVTADSEDLLALSPLPAWSPATQEALDVMFATTESTLEQVAWLPDTMAGRISEVPESIAFSKQAMNPELENIQRMFPEPQEHQSYEVTISRPLTPLNVPASSAQSAWILLKHYLSTVLRSLTPFRHSKTPWHILFVPLVKNCLAGLALQEHVDNAALCVFYGTLAVSALSLSNTSRSSSWTKESNGYRQHARMYADLTISNAYDVPKISKYKNLLMALLTIAQVSMTFGQKDETERFLLEAEKLIRLRGLDRKKSRKVRLLHHCYAYERILFESTVCSQASSLSPYRLSIMSAVESSGAVIHSQDSLYFQLPVWDDLETEMLRVKDQVQGENDLHLQLLGTWPSTLYPEIFGVPETYLSLISLIVRLSREKEAQEEGNGSSSSPLCLSAFSSRAKAIERFILRQRQHQRPGSADDMQNLLEVFHHAILIYFYRRIHDVDGSMLQPLVRNVQDCLLRYDAAGAEEGYGHLRLIWPAFIAACEADDMATQSFFAGWFDKSARSSGLRLFDIQLASVEQVWQEKRRAWGL